MQEFYNTSESIISLSHDDFKKSFLKFIYSLITGWSSIWLNSPIVIILP